MRQRPAAPWYLPLLAASGCAALIYEIVWFQLLEFVIGSTAISLAVLLGTFMGGMCLGSLALPRLVSTQRHPLRVYGLLEIGIGVGGLAVFAALPLIVRAFSEGAGHGAGGIFVRGAVCAVCLLPPTVLMGATLPAISRLAETTADGVSWLGFFYGANTFGAVMGCLFAGFYLLRVHDMLAATGTAAAINLAAAVLALALAARTTRPAGGAEAAEPDRGRPEAGPGEPRSDPVGHPGEPEPSGAASIYVAIALSGLSGLGAEVVWTRLLSLILGPTVYTFSIILAVFLLGIGIGGALGAYLARGLPRPRALFGAGQLLLALAIAWTAYTVTKSLPYWPVNELRAANPWYRFSMDFGRCLWAILPAAVLWGASFPLALAAAARRGQDPARLVGGIYAANTVGAIIGAIAFSLVVVPWAGTRQAERALIALAAAAALIALLGDRRTFGTAKGRVAGLAAAAAAAAGLVVTVPATPGELVAYGRALLTSMGTAQILYMGEGMNSSVAVSETSDGVRNFHVSGKVEASTTPQDMRLQRMLGHLPAMLHARPRSVLIVGCGAGVTAGSFVVQPGIERIVICEIEPLVPRVVARYFAPQNHRVVQDPRVEIVYDDARHYILTTREKFDIITSDPIHPWVKGSASLYTQEYFELCRARLNPGGMVTQWVPLYESNEKTVKSEIATFFRVFPDGTIWGNDDSGAGYDAVLLGQNGPARFDLDRLRDRWTSPDYRQTAVSLSEAGFDSPSDLIATYAGRAAELAPWLADAQINRDRNLRLQYLAGMGLDSSLEDVIYRHMLAYCQDPGGIFVGSRRAQEEFLSAWRNRPAP